MTQYISKKDSDTFTEQFHITIKGRTTTQKQYTTAEVTALQHSETMRAMLHGRSARGRDELLWQVRAVRVVCRIRRSQLSICRCRDERRARCYVDKMEGGADPGLCLTSPASMTLFSDGGRTMGAAALI